MLTIRLTRKGRKNQPFFRVVVIDKRMSAKGGRAVEILGYIDPLTKKKSLKKDRILHWIKNGAQPSATIHNLLVSEKIIEGKKIHVAKVKAASVPNKTSASQGKTSEMVAPASAPTVAPAALSPSRPEGHPATEDKKAMADKEKSEKPAQ